jgi:NAD(P)-dependent dehydrogenase (short-subunit alcohol dehydrogenase family)
MSFTLQNVPSQQGKIAIVTGANAGLGYETVIGLSQKEAKVIMACRNMEKAEKAKSNILDKLPHADLDIMQLDLASLKFIRAFADHFRNKYNKLDLLINNAGVMMPPKSTTKDGFELQFGVNHLGHFLLTALLIELMPDHSDSRIVSLSSIVHKGGEIHFDDLQWENSYDRQDTYSQSKLACLMFGDELDRRLRAAGKEKLSVTAHPGTSPTELSRHLPSWFTALFNAIGPLFRHAPDKGAQPTLKAALDTSVSGGDYYGPQGFREMKGEPGHAKRSEVAKDKKTAKKLWEISETLTDCTFTV